MDYFGFNMNPKIKNSENIMEKAITHAIINLS
jgi:hypothetical protein